MMGLPLLAAGVNVWTDSYSEFGLVQPDKSPAALERKYADGDSEFVELRNARVHYRDEGQHDGQTVVMIHGGYSSLHTWDGWVSALADEFRLVRLDLPGFGLTGPREGEHTVSELIKTVAALCESLELSDVTVAGSSLGGGVAWRLAVARSDLVSRLLLLNAGGATLLSVLSRKLVSVAGPFAQRYMSPRVAARLVLRNAYGDVRALTDETVRRYHELLLRRGNRKAIAELARNYERDHFDPEADDRGVRLPTVSAHGLTPDVWDDFEIRDVSVPTLFQWGAEDSWLPEAFGRELAARVPDSSFLSYDGVGHMPMEETPERTAADAAAFFSA